MVSWLRRNLSKLALGVLFVASCHRGPEPFAIAATYDAPKSGVRVIAWSSGTVQPGHDMADGSPVTVVVCPMKKIGRPTTVEVPAAPGKKDPTVSILTRALNDANYAIPDPAELAELADSIDGVALGPKATRIAGQTHQLVVASVNFEAHQPPTIDSCPP